MPRWSFHLWVLLVAVLLQIGRGQASVEDAQVADLGHAPMATSGEADAQDETSEGSSFVDEAFEAGMWSSSDLDLRAQYLVGQLRRAGGLSRGRPASDTPFKPPRA